MNDLQKQNTRTLLRMIQDMRGVFPGQDLCIIVPRPIMNALFECEFYDGMAMSIYGIPVYVGPEVVVGLRAEIR